MAVLTVQAVVNWVSQDVRSLLASSGSDGNILVSFVERIQQDMMRAANWPFERSQPKRFVTAKGISTYWIGAVGTGPVGVQDSGINIADMQYIAEGTVFDRSNFVELGRQTAAPNIEDLQYQDGSQRLGRPDAYLFDPENPNYLNIYPAPDNQNGYRPSPMAPAWTTVVSGALPARTYYIQATYLDSLGGESTASTEAKIYVPANQVLKLYQPQLTYAPPNSASGVAYNGWNVYVSTASNGECLQNLSTIGATSWQEPNTGLLTGTATPPTTNNVATLDGYIIEFEYFKSRPTGVLIGDNLTIPSDYKDVLTAGTNMLAYQFLNKPNDAQMWASQYQAGLRAMIRDRNLTPRRDFIHPDPASY